MAAEGGAPSLDLVRNLLARLAGRQPSFEELQSVRPALDELYDRVARLRRQSPLFRRVAFGPDVWALMKLIGKPPLPGDADTWRAAAML